MLLKSSKCWISAIQYKISSTKISHYSTTTKQSWDLASSVCLERIPIITKNLSDLELSYSEILDKTEFEMSRKSNHEITLMRDKLFAEELKKQDSYISSDQVSTQTAQDFEDVCNAELKSYKFANRLTPEDLEKDLTSINRKLSDPLLLVVKQSIGNQSKWMLPQGIHQKGETMRQTAERVLSETCGNNLQTKFLGNAPCGFYKFRYPKSANIDNVGLKIFFFKAWLIDGSVSKEVCKDFKWLSSRELDVLQEDYLRSVRTFLTD